jgi:hypothetical protein
MKNLLLKIPFLPTYIMASLVVVVFAVNTLIIKMPILWYFSKSFTVSMKNWWQETIELAEKLFNL